MHAQADAMHDTRSAGLKKLFCVSIYLYWSRCWPFKLPVTAGFRFWMQL